MLNIWFVLYSTFTIYEIANGHVISENASKSTKHQSESNSHSESSSHRSKKGSYSYKTVHSSPSTGYYSELDYLPLKYRLKYASDFDFYDPDLDLDLDFIGSSLLDTDVDLDYDLSDVDLDLDLLKLKYGFYGLNYYSKHSPNFNEYKFRRFLRNRRKPHYRLRHRYFPSYWKPNLDFWGLDNYSLGFGYNNLAYDIDSPTSYVHVRRY